EASFLPFNRFVNACITRHLERRASAPWGEAVPFLGFMLRHGLRFSTVAGAARSTAASIATRTAWRSAFVLEDLQLDLFLHQYRRLQPHFSIFFANSVAHLQHNYPNSPGAGQADGAVLPAGYRHLDRLLDRLL